MKGKIFFLLGECAGLKTWQDEKKDQMEKENFCFHIKGFWICVLFLIVKFLIEIIIKSLNFCHQSSKTPNPTKWFLKIVLEWVNSFSWDLVFWSFGGDIFLF